jgi:3-oxoacyl-[acyl-carrier protein] reductase
MTTRVSASDALNPPPALPSFLPLAGQVAVVTGASRGLGRAFATGLLRAGVRVALVARSRQPMEDLAAAFPPGQAAVFPHDLADARSATALVDSVQAAMGPPHLLIHAAAPMHAQKRVMQLEDGEIQQQLQEALGVATGLCRALLPGMLGHRYGRVVLVGSLAASHGSSGSALYGAVKAGMEGLVRGLAVDHGRHGITANVLRVGFADTERLAQRTAAGGRDKLEAATVTRRIPTPDQIAHVALFLCSPASAVVTGTVVDATAGSHLNTLW